MAKSWHVTSAWPPSRGGVRCVWGTPTSWRSRAGHAACHGARRSPKPRLGLGRGDGEGGGGERGEEPAKHHSGLHFIAMATSWKPYRIRAAEHQIREAAAGRTLAPHARSRAPQVLGDRVSEEPGGAFPPLVWGTASCGSSCSSGRVQDSVPRALIPLAALLPPSPSGHSSPATALVILEKKVKFTLQTRPPHGILLWLGAVLLQAPTGNPQSQKGKRAKRLCSVPQMVPVQAAGWCWGGNQHHVPLCEMASPGAGCRAAPAPCAGGERLVSF